MPAETMQIARGVVALSSGLTIARKPSLLSVSVVLFALSTRYWPARAGVSRAEEQAEVDRSRVSASLSKSDILYT